MTQQKLAELANVSLPTVQKLERGGGNPSLDVLLKLARVLGMTISLEPSPVDWDALSRLGVPLTSTENASHADLHVETLLLKLREALAAPHDKIEDRNVDALAATLLALKTHWPRTFNRLGPLVKRSNELISKRSPERLLKLRALAINRLQTYL